MAPTPPTLLQLALRAVAAQLANAARGGSWSLESGELVVIHIPVVEAVLDALPHTPELALQLFLTCAHSASGTLPLPLPCLGSLPPPRSVSARRWGSTWGA